jgi:ubiquinone/menaquinone biosynthesis C-methylase UbiE
MESKPKLRPGDSTHRNKTTAIYESWVGAKFYGLWGLLTESRAHARAWEAAQLAPGDAVLEVAVGTGVLFSRVARVKGLERCIGVELASGMLHEAQRRLQPLLRPPNALCRGDARQLPFPAQTFDLILNAYMLDLLPEDDIREVLKEFRQTVKPAGRLVLLTMAKQNRLLQGAWMWLYGRWPALVGGCRPIRLDEFLAATGWRVDLHEMVSQCGFRSELIRARPA